MQFGFVMLPVASRDLETYRIIGAAMAVHRELGHGFLERVYKLALPIEFERRGIPFSIEVALPIHYKGVLLPTGYTADFVCENGVVVEVKAADCLSSNDEGQLLNYLKASNLRRGLLINFGAPTLQYKRRVWATSRPAAPGKARRAQEDRAPIFRETARS